jgi:Alpha/beta hydrolase domain
MILHSPSFPTAFIRAGLFLSLYAVLSACSSGSNNSNNNDNATQASTLGVPGAGNASTVSVPAAMIKGPIAGAPVLVSTFFSLAALGYEQAEFFVSGTANAYTNVNEFTSDGY